MFGKRTTGSDGIAAAGPPPRTRAADLVRAARARLELALAHEVRHRPTRGQVRLMARLDGHSPSTYRLDADVNPLPARPPTDFPYGSDGLRFASPRGEIVALPGGDGFSL